MHGDFPPPPPTCCQQYKLLAGRLSIGDSCWGASSLFWHCVTAVKPGLWLQVIKPVSQVNAPALTGINWALAAACLQAK